MLILSLSFDTLQQQQTSSRQAKHLPMMSKRKVFCAFMCCDDDLLDSFGNFYAVHVALMFFVESTRRKRM